MDNQKNYIQDLINGLKSNNKEQKLLSVSALGILREKEHAKALTDLLASTDNEIVEQVITVLGHIGSPASVKHLVDFLNNTNSKLSTAALKALQSFDLTDALDAVIRSCTSDLPSAVRKNYLDILLNYNDIRVASLMNEVMGQTADPELLIATIDYFIRYPSTEKHTSLKMLSSNTNWNVSLAANLALSRLKDEHAYAQVRRLAKSSNTEVRSIIVKALSKRPQIEDREMFSMFFEDNSAEIREMAIEGLSLFATDERISILRTWLAKESDSNFKIALVKKAAAEKSVLLYDEIYKLLQSSDELMQIAASEAITAMGEKIADRILIDFDRMPLVVKEQMILILGKIGGSKVITTIKECLFARERWLRINAIEAASTINSPELNNELIKMVQNQDTDIWVMATAVSALGKTLNQEYTEFISKQLAHEDARVRANAIEALSRLKWENLDEACSRMLIDKNDRVRVNSAIALWKNGNEEVFQALEKMSKDKSRWVRASAVFALGRIKDKSATPILLTIIADSEDMVYRNVIEALAEQGDLRSLLPLLRESRKARLPKHFFDKALQRFTETLKS